MYTAGSPAAVGRSALSAEGCAPAPAGLARPASFADLASVCTLSRAAGADGLHEAEKLGHYGLGAGDLEAVQLPTVELSQPGCRRLDLSAAGTPCQDLNKRDACGGR